MAKRPVNRHEQDPTSEIFVEPLIMDIHGGLFEVARCLRDTGWVRTAAFDNMQVTVRNEYCHKVNSLRKPVELTSSHKLQFTIYTDVLKSYIKEFQTFLDDKSLEDIERLVSAYSIGTALGEYAFRQGVKDPSFARTPLRLRAISNLLNDRNDFIRHFRSRIDDEHLKKLMAQIDDSVALDINGMRAGLTVVRSAIQQIYGVDFITDDLVLDCNSALEDFVHNHGPEYVMVSRYFGSTEENGVSAFTYAIPEWLYILSVPMKPEKLETIFDKKFVTDIGQPDESWIPYTTE